MARIYAICNQKDGVGKTVTAVSLGIGLAREGKRVLLVDVDAQGSLTASLGYQHPDQMEVTLATVMGQVIQDLPLQPGMGILHHSEGVDLLPANIELSGLEVTLVNTMSRETVLRECLRGVQEQYDVILLDCCPSLGMLTINALAAADQVLISSFDGKKLSDWSQTVTASDKEKANEGDMDVYDFAQTTTVYKLFADTEGNVYLYKIEKKYTGTGLDSMDNEIAAMVNDMRDLNGDTRNRMENIISMVSIHYIQEHERYHQRKVIGAEQQSILI